MGLHTCSTVLMFCMNLVLFQMCRYKKLRPSNGCQCLVWVHLKHSILSRIPIGWRQWYTLAKVCLVSNFLLRALVCWVDVLSSDVESCCAFSVWDSIFLGCLHLGLHHSHTCTWHVISHLKLLVTEEGKPNQHFIWYFDLISIMWVVQWTKWLLSYTISWKVDGRFVL